MDIDCRGGSTAALLSLQGGGILFNRTAGPTDQPGIVNGVLVSRIRTDVSLADFEIGLRNLVSNVENAYWDLYFAYRDLDAKKKARDNALESWQDVKAKMDAGDEGGEADKEGQAREQYWRFESEVIDSLNGRLVESTRNQNGSGGGTFRNVPGVRVAERRLRLAMGMPITDNALIRPAEEPPEAPIQYDWNTVVHQAYELRPELRKQRWRVKQRELELSANRNFLLPRLDAVGRYRLRGFGEKLMSAGDGQFHDSLGDLATGDQQEWQVGLEFSVPLGYRRAHAAVRNSELQIARDRAILDEQKRTIVYGLSNAVADVRRAYEVVMAQYNRYTAAQSQVAAVKASQDAGKAPLDLLLEAQRRLVDAETRFHQSRVDYALALKNVQYEKGTLLEYYSIRMAEGPSTHTAYVDAARRDRLKTGTIDYVCRDKTISTGQASIGTLDYPSDATGGRDDSTQWHDHHSSLQKPNPTLELDAVTIARADELPWIENEDGGGHVRARLVSESVSGNSEQPDARAGLRESRRRQQQLQSLQQRDAAAMQRLAGKQVPADLTLPYEVPTNYAPSRTRSTPASRVSTRSQLPLTDLSKLTGKTVPSNIKLPYPVPKSLGANPMNEAPNVSTSVGTNTSVIGDLTAPSKPAVEPLWIPPRRSTPIVGGSPSTAVPELAANGPDSSREGAHVGPASRPRRGPMTPTANASSSTDRTGSTVPADPTSQQATSDAKVLESVPPTSDASSEDADSTPSSWAVFGK